MPRLLTSWLPRTKKFARRLRRAGFALGIEPLEDRTMLTAGLPPDIVVGRALPAYFAGDVRNTAPRSAATHGNSGRSLPTGPAEHLADPTAGGPCPEAVVPHGFSEHLPGSGVGV